MVRGTIPEAAETQFGAPDRLNGLRKGRLSAELTVETPVSQPEIDRKLCLRQFWGIEPF